MTIEYALTRKEVVLGYFRSLRSSQGHSVFLVICTLAIFTLVPQIEDGFSHPFTMGDARVSVIGTIGALLFLLPSIIFIRAKTAIRTLTISPEGVSTRIGSLSGQVAWRKIKIVQENESHVLIASASGNAFYIPKRAFANTEQEAEFVTSAQAWVKATRDLN